MHSTDTPATSSSANASLPLSAKARRTAESPINALIAAKLANPDLINFAAGLVDEETLPVDEVSAITRRIFGDAAGTAGRSNTARRWACGRCAKSCSRTSSGSRASRPRSWALGRRHLLTTGSQQALYLIADVLLDPGDIVIAANPSYFVFTGTLQSLVRRSSPSRWTKTAWTSRPSVGCSANSSAGRARSREVHLLHELLRQPDRPDPLTTPRERLVEIVKEFSATTAS